MSLQNIQQSGHFLKEFDTAPSIIEELRSIFGGQDKVDEPSFFPHGHVGFFILSDLQFNFTYIHSLSQVKGRPPWIF